MKKALLFFLTVWTMALFAQEEDSFLEIQGQYRGFFLGMSLEQCKEALENDPYFLSQDLDQPSLMQREEETLLDCRGRSFIQRAWFQFYQERLVVMIIQLNESKLDYYTLYSDLEGKYGPPMDLSPQMALWENDSQTLQLELSRPLQVKYLDRAFLDGQLESSRIQRAFEEELRENFLEDF